VIRHYKNNTGQFFGFEDGVAIPDGMTELTAEELGALFNPATPEPTAAEQIAALEASITHRNLRGAALGDQFAIDKIQAVEDEIDALRE
tara:strand:- start:595 stop:861 length:267 start_codon:yes stop_codon:yes gene_type:complete